MNETELAVRHSGAIVGDSPEPLNVSSEEMAQITADMGFNTVSPDIAKKLHKLGVGLDNLGRVKANNGALFLTHQTMLKAIQKLGRIIEGELSIEDLKVATHALGALSREMAKSVKVSNESEVTVTQAATAGKHLLPSFTPGAVVQQNNYHYYGTGEKPAIDASKKG